VRIKAGRTPRKLVRRPVAKATQREKEKEAPFVGMVTRNLSCGREREQGRDDNPGRHAKGRSSEEKSFNYIHNALRDKKNFKGRRGLAFRSAGYAEHQRVGEFKAEGSGRVESEYRFGWGKAEGAGL